MATSESASLRERLGHVIGRAWAPAIAALTHVRHARMFHPDGHTFTGISEPNADPTGPYAAVAAALAGPVLARCSAALWRGDSFEHLDVLGLAIRFRPDADTPPDHHARPGDTDLLTATIRSPLTMLLSPFTTDATDFAGNTYWAVSPFAVGDLRFELRLVPVDPPPATEGSRTERLACAVAAGHAVWQLEARKTLRLQWAPVAKISLDRPATVDQRTLKFDPFRGALRPVGLVHAIRRAVYAAGQHARDDEPQAS